MLPGQSGKLFDTKLEKHLILTALEELLLNLAGSAGDTFTKLCDALKEICERKPELDYLAGSYYLLAGTT